MKIFLIFILFSANVLSFSDCSELSSDCEFYSCVESKKHCGKRDYLIGFGQKYCSKFEENRPRFSFEGRKWIQQVKKCLIRNMDRLDDGLSCSGFKSQAISHHVPCYVNSGYCELSRRDKNAVFGVIIGSLWRPSLISAGIRVLQSCRK